VADLFETLLRRSLGMGLLGQINGSGIIIKVDLTEIGWCDGN